MVLGADEMDEKAPSAVDSMKMIEIKKTVGKSDGRLQGADKKSQRIEKKNERIRKTGLQKRHREIKGAH